MSDRIYLIIIAVLVGYVIFLQQCQQPEIVEVPGEPVVTTDTLQLPPDTVRVPGPVQYVEIPVPAPSDSTEDGVRTYRQPYSDAWMTATFEAKVRGTLLDWNFEYVPITRQITKPSYIIRNTITPVHFTRGSEPVGTNLLLGAGLKGNLMEQSFELKAGIDRKDYIYLGEYDPMLKKYGFTIIRKFSF